MTTETAVKERPILFSGPMVRAILAGKKTQTRRVVMPQPSTDFKYCRVKQVGKWFHIEADEPETVMHTVHCRYGVPGDRLWVRETFSATYGSPERHSSDVKKSDRTKDNLRDLLFGADFAGPTPKSIKGIWIPSIHMPRWASRILLEVTDVRVERLQEITDQDAAAEGFDFLKNCPCNGVPAGFDLTSWCKTHGSGFVSLWEHLNAPRGYGWDVNPWVWVVSFRRINA